MQLNQRALHILEVSLQRIQKPLRLEVFRRGADRQALVLDDVSDAVAISGHRAEAEQTQRGISTVRGRKNGRAEKLPAWICEDGRQGRLAAAVPATAVPGVGAGGREGPVVDRVGLALALEKAVQRVQMPVDA